MDGKNRGSDTGGDRRILAGPVVRAWPVGTRMARSHIAPAWQEWDGDAMIVCERSQFVTYIRTTQTSRFRARSIAGHIPAC
jgi:hypothetical protein